MLFVNRVCNLLSRRKVPYALVGGHAVALHGAVRGTFDLDIAIRWTLANLEKTESALQELGLTSQLPISAIDVFNFRDEYIRNRNLIAWCFRNPRLMSEQVDVLVNYDLATRKVVTLKTSGGPIRVLNIEDLIDMKREAGREQDLQDVDALEKLR